MDHQIDIIGELEPEDLQQVARMVGPIARTFGGSVSGSRSMAVTA
ncbi:MAG: hypothetical protein R2823_02360 [Acidimicrobiia bacterium]